MDKQQENPSVKIVGYTPLPEAIASAGARISTTLGTAHEIYEKSAGNPPEKNHNLIRKVLQSGHLSTVEHICFNLSFNNVSVYAEQFLIEFRLASFTVKSRRYVDFSSMGCYRPSFAGMADPAEAGRLYDAQVNRLLEGYQALVDAGVPKEDARFLLPYCVRSNFYCTVNARELSHMLEAMLCGRGRHYPELVELGRSLLTQGMEICPPVFERIREEAPESSDKEGRIRALLSTLPGTNGGKRPPVEILSGTQDAAAAVACTAALNATGGSVGPEDPRLEDPALQGQILAAVMADSRRRELEHAVFTLRINGISLPAITHLVRHRMHSVQIPSLPHACDFSRFVLPPSVGEAGLEERYTALFAETGRLADLLLEKGMSRYDLVYLMPSGLTLDVITTMNGRALDVFIGLRTCSRSQWEIREIATRLLELLRERSPLLFDRFGPKCYRDGYCNEGRMSCGKQKEVAERFSPKGGEQAGKLLTIIH